MTSLKATTNLESIKRPQSLFLHPTGLHSRILLACANAHRLVTGLHATAARYDNQSRGSNAQQTQTKWIHSGSRHTRRMRSRTNVQKQTFYKLIFIHDILVMHIINKFSCRKKLQLQRLKHANQTTACRVDATYKSGWVYQRVTSSLWPLKRNAFPNTQI